MEQDPAEKRRQQQQEVAANSKAFANLLPKLLTKGNEGRYALMHNQKVEGVLNNFHDALIMGDRMFGNKPFSIQPIARTPINLGAYSYLR